MRGNLGNERKKTGNERLFKKALCGKAAGGKERKSESEKRLCLTTKPSGARSFPADKGQEQQAGKACHLKQSKPASKNCPVEGEGQNGEMRKKGEKSVPKTKPPGMESCQAAKNVSWKKALKGVQRAAQNARPAGHCAQKRTPVSKKQRRTSFPRTHPPPCRQRHGSNDSQKKVRMYAVQSKTVKKNATAPHRG